MKDNNNETGRDRKILDKLDDILGHRPATQPEHIVDTSAQTEESQEGSLLLADGSDEGEIDSVTQQDSVETSREEE